MPQLNVTIRQEEWLLKKPFIIARGEMSRISLVMAEITDGVHTGKGESCPTDHYGETPDSVIKQMKAAAWQLEHGVEWSILHDEIAPGAARNALDCAVWDLRAKQTGRPVWKMLDMAPLQPVETVFTISLDNAENMAAEAGAAKNHNILKLKLGAPGDVERVQAIRAAVPSKRLIVDVNEGWTEADLRKNLPIMAELGIEMVEQPLPAGKDEILANIDHVVPLGADESCHTVRDLKRVSRLYDVINIKLDKTGGLTEAFKLVSAGKAQGLDIMVGCMLGTSLAMAPGMLVAQFARFVDLDAPLLIGRDRDPSLTYIDGTVSPPTRALWG